MRVNLLGGTYSAVDLAGIHAGSEARMLLKVKLSAKMRIAGYEHGGAGTTATPVESILRQLSKLSN